PHLQAAVIAVHARRAAFGRLELGAPHQRGIAEHPEVGARALCTPFGHGVGHHRGAVAFGGNPGGGAFHGVTRRAYNRGLVCHTTFEESVAWPHRITNPSSASLRWS